VPRYFFSCEGYDNFVDREGVVLADLGSAKAEAVSMMGEILRSHPTEFTGRASWRLMVQDEGAHTLFVLHFTAESFA